MWYFHISDKMWYQPVNAIWLYGCPPSAENLIETTQWKWSSDSGGTIKLTSFILPPITHQSLHIPLLLGSVALPLLLHFSPQQRRWLGFVFSKNSYKKLKNLKYSFICEEVRNHFNQQSNFTNEREKESLKGILVLLLTASK